MLAGRQRNPFEGFIKAEGISAANHQRPNGLLSAPAARRKLFRHVTVTSVGVPTKAFSTSAPKVAIDTPVLDDETIGNRCNRLAQWIALHFACSAHAAIRLILPDKKFIANVQTRDFKRTLNGYAHSKIVYETHRPCGNTLSYLARAKNQIQRQRFNALVRAMLICC